MAAGAVTSIDPLQWLEQTYAAVPVTVPAWLRNAYLRRTTATDLATYEYPPDPFEPRTVDPTRIEAFTGRPFPPYRDRVADLGTVRGGEWDRREEPPLEDENYRHRYELYRGPTFTESVFYQSLATHFQDGVAWTDTPFIRRCLDLVDRDEQVWRSMTNKEEILDRCAYVDALYDSIRTHGYRPQRELGVDSVLGITDEVAVDIGRDGRLLFVNGRHRLAIARLLDIDSIPVCVLVRHPEWMETRASAIHEQTTMDHPDVPSVEE